MKKFLNKIIIVLCFSVILTGCSGAADYKVILNNDYYIAKTSAHNAKIYKIENKDTSGKAPSIPTYHGNDEDYEKESVIKVGQDDRYIIAQTSINKYYILDTKEESVMEFLSKDEFDLKKKDLKISNIKLKDLDEYKKENDL